MTIRKHVLIAVAILGLFLAALVVTTATKADATGGGHGEPCVPAWTETIEHPAETHTVEHPAVTHEETRVVSEGMWLNFSPNKDQKKFVGPPAYPTDDRGTWQHWGDGKDIPPGHAGPDGVYQKGHGNGSWFYRQAEVTETVVIVDKEAWTETVVDKEAWTETIEHPQTGDCDEPDTPVGDLHAFAVQGDCDAPGYIQINQVEGVQWYLDGSPVEAGKHEFPGGVQADVYAVPLDGFSLADNVVGSQAHPFFFQVNPQPSGEACEPETPEQPEPVVTEASSTSYECGDDFATVTHTVTTTAYVWDEQAGEWVLGEPNTVETVTLVDHPVVPCDETPEEPEEPENPENPENPEEPKQPEPREPRQPNTPVTVPTSVEAGL